MYVVYVLDREGNPLMPTKRFGHVRRLLKSGQAKAVSTKPFVVQLLSFPARRLPPLRWGMNGGACGIISIAVRLLLEQKSIFNQRSLSRFRRSTPSCRSTT